MDDQQEFQKLIDERIAQLPKVVQDAIKSAEVTAKLRKVAEAHKLHVDQWETLEKEVQYTLLGFQPSEELEQNIQSEVGVTADVAHELAESISLVVFEPIREALERGLEHPQAKAETVSDVETARKEAIASEKASNPTTTNTAATPTPTAATPVQPATPPAAAPTGAAKRESLSTSYLTSTPSHERPNIDGDPYREQTA